MAELGFSIVGLVKAIDNMQKMAGIVEISEDTYVISPDHKATETDGPYPPYSVLQEFGWTGNPGNPYMRPALREAERNFGHLTGVISANHSFIDDRPADALMKAVAKFIEERAKAFAPVDTGLLKETIFSKKIDK